MAEKTQEWSFDHQKDWILEFLQMRVNFEPFRLEEQFLPGPCYVLAVLLLGCLHIQLQHGEDCFFMKGV